MKQTSSFPRRTAFAIAAASAGLTLAVTATIAGSLGLIAPAAPVATPSTGQEQPIPHPPTPVMGDALASIPTDPIGQPPTAEIMRQMTRVEESRSVRSKHDDDDDRGRRLRRSSSGDAAAGRSASQVLSRAHHEDDDDD